MTRRQLGRLAAGAALLQKSPARAASNYTGALDGFESKVDAASFDPVLFTRELYQSARLEMTFNATTRKQAETLQKRLRVKLAELLGGFPKTRVELEPQTLETREFPRYRREKVVFRSKPGTAALAYLLTPKDA